MKNDDYSKWLKNYKQRVKNNVDNNVYKLRQNDNEYMGFTPIAGYYEWTKEAFATDNIKANVSLSVSDSFFDRFETALARVDVVLDRLLDYLHEQKNL